MDSDILISGGGIAGLTAAAAFSAAGFRVTCVDPAPPVTLREAEGADLRSTAFLQPAREFLDSIGLWARLAPFATPLQVMRMVDAAGRAQVSRAFDAQDISDAPFGWNLPNWLLRREMAAFLAETGVDFRPGTATTGLVTRSDLAQVSLSDGSPHSTRLVIAADGRGSPMRQAAGIEVRTWRFGQKALAFAVTHDAPHDNISTEIHQSGGPFTLVPLPDHDGRPSSAVVWMEEAAKADALAALAVAPFEAEMTERSAGVLGDLRLASRRTLWPIIAQEARRLSSQRLALVAEAAHVMPPIGAQGLNMSLRDLSVLRDLAMADPDGLGGAAMLAAYHRKRIGDIRLRVAGIAALNRVSQSGFAPVQRLRGKGIKALHDITPLRHAAMRLGLGTGSGSGG